MTRVRELSFEHPVVVFDGGDHWRWVEALATEPPTSSGIGAFVRYRDDVATRYGYLVSSWSTEKDGDLYVGVAVYGVAGDAPGGPPAGHPSNDRRFRRIAEACAARDVAAARRLSVPAEPDGPLLWARRADGGPLVPLSVHPGDGATDLEIRAAGLLPATTELLLAAEGAAALVDGAPVAVDVPVYSYTHPKREKVAARVAAGRATPVATLRVGTLAQFEVTGSGG